MVVIKIVKKDKIVLVCHVILEDHVIKTLKAAITIFSKAHGISHSHIQNFTIKVALRKPFTSVSSDSSLILVAPSCVTNGKLHAKKTSVGPSKNSGNKERGKKEERKAIAKLFGYTQAQKAHIEVCNVSQLVIYVF